MNFQAIRKLNNVRGLKSNSLCEWLEIITSHCLKSYKCKLLLYNLVWQIEIFFFLLVSTLKIGQVPYLSLTKQVVMEANIVIIAYCF